MMKTYSELYQTLLRQSIEGKHQPDGLSADETYDPYHLDCLLHPHKHGVVLKTAPCNCPDSQKQSCLGGCLFDALYLDENKQVRIDEQACAGCAACIANCHKQTFRANSEVLALLYAMRESAAPVYAMIAPAFISQFENNVTPGQLRSAFKQLGFAGMLEVSLFADILTLRESLEFDRHVHHEDDFLLTSCCCPLWIALIRKMPGALLAHIPGSVSPMTACGRSIKKLYPEALTVFIGPCLAKKAEAREADLRGAVDFVLTFEEVAELLEILTLAPQNLADDTRDHSSQAGRLYARAGGVSRAVESSVKRLYPQRAIALKSQTADGVAACRDMLNDLLAGNIKANFLEGMGCVGGCVGGPKAILAQEQGAQFVEEYAKEAGSKTPIENPYVIELLRRLGFEKTDSLLAPDNMFSRRFTPITKEK